MPAGFCAEWTTLPAHGRETQPLRSLQPMNTGGSTSHLQAGAGKACISDSITEKEMVENITEYLQGEQQLCCITRILKNER